MLMLLEYHEVISVEVSAKAMVPLVVVGRAVLSTEIHVFGVLMENHSPVNMVVLSEVSVVPQEVRRRRKEKITSLFMVWKIRK